VTRWRGLVHEKMLGSGYFDPRYYEDTQVIKTLTNVIKIQLHQNKKKSNYLLLFLPLPPSSYLQRGRGGRKKREKKDEF